MYFLVGGLLVNIIRVEMPKIKHFKYCVKILLDLFC